MATWEWATSSILHQSLHLAAPNDLFHAVCAELGRYYHDRGFRYTASRPKLVRQHPAHRAEICFWSSRSNQVGAYVLLEILPWVYSMPYKRWSQPHHLPSSNGLLSGGPHLFHNTTYRNHVNLAHVDHQLFAQLIAGIDSVILPHFQLYDDLDTLSEHITAESYNGWQSPDIIQYFIFRESMDLARKVIVKLLDSRNAAIVQEVGELRHDYPDLFL